MQRPLFQNTHNRVHDTITRITFTWKASSRARQGSTLPCRRSHDRPRLEGPRKSAICWGPPSNRVQVVHFLEADLQL